MSTPRERFSPFCRECGLLVDRITEECGCNRTVVQVEEPEWMKEILDPVVGR